MECPNCGEGIDDEAVAFSHCGRDLTLIKPLSFRLDAVEIQVVELRGDPATVAASPISTPEETPHQVGTDRETQAKQKAAGGLRNKMAAVWSGISPTLYMALGIVGMGFIVRNFYPDMDIKLCLELGLLLSFVIVVIGLVIFLIVSLALRHHDK